MASPPSIRPVLALGFAAALTACGSSEAEADRFESMAEAMAAVPLGDRVAGSRSTSAPPAVAVEVMSPHALWDARDADSGPVQRLAVAAAPALARAVVTEARDEIVRVVQPEPAPVASDLKPEAKPLATAQARPQRTEAAPRVSGLVQLGAYADEAAARAAWTRLSTGSAAWALEGLAPIYEPATAGDRTVVRLKTRAPGAGAAALCAAAGVDDPWCHRGG